jgi:hypothetical protein
LSLNNLAYSCSHRRSTERSSASMPSAMQNMFQKKHDGDRTAQIFIACLH